MKLGTHIYLRWQYKVMAIPSGIHPRIPYFHPHVIQIKKIPEILFWILFLISCDKILLVILTVVVFIDIFSRTLVSQLDN